MSSKRKGKVDPDIGEHPCSHGWFVTRPTSSTGGERVRGRRRLTGGGRVGGFVAEIGEIAFSLKAASVGTND